MKKYIKFLGTCVIALSVVACQKGELSNNELETFDEVVNSEMESHDIESHESDEIQSKCTGAPFKTNFPECATVMVSSEEFPKTVTIDFGDGCADKNGKVKKGKVIITVSALMKEEGSYRKITFEDFSIGNIDVKGVRVVTNKGVNEKGNLVFSIEGEITTYKNKKYRSRKIDRQREWIAGSETCDKSDDEFLITGTKYITTSKSKKTIVRKIIKPVHTSKSCKYPMSGVLSIEGGKRSGKIDFGDGTCDNIATLTTSKGKVKEIDLDARKCKK